MADDGLSAEELRRLQDQFAALGVEEFLVSTATTIASLAYAKLDARDLAQAKKAIDALASLVPHVEGELGGELRTALASLQLAFVEASSA